MGSSCQVQFWNNFTTIKRNAIYINRYHEKVERQDRQLSMFSAIASSASIGAWVVWKDAWLLWTAVIAASQVLTAIRPYLPTKSHLTALTALGPELDGLALAAETEWFAVSHGRLTDEEIHKQTMALKQRSHAAQNKAFKGMSLAEDGKLLAIAKSEALDYMTTIAGDEDEQDATSALAAADDDQEGLGPAAAADGRADAQGFAAQGTAPAQEVGADGGPYPDAEGSTIGPRGGHRAARGPDHGTDAQGVPTQAR